MKYLFRFGLGIIFCFAVLPCFAMENVFYILRSSNPDQLNNAQAALNSLAQHYQSINILTPQAYQIDENGVVYGAVDASVLNFARKLKLKIMPLVTNKDFDKARTHLFLANAIAQAQAIQTLTNICVDQHFYGLQLDFEMVAKEDRDALTQFYQNLAVALHQQNCKLSLAIAPVVNNQLASPYLKKIYENWEAAYDLPKLGALADFVSVMGYNLHGGVTTPGPTASIDWIEAVIQNTLQYIPADKISLGVPLYSNYWYMGRNLKNTRIGVQSIGITYGEAKFLLHKYRAQLQWDNVNKNNFTMFENDWLNEYIYIEDTKSLQAKIALAKKYNLRGISGFTLGAEDPKIWKVVQSRGF